MEIYNKNNIFAKIIRGEILCDEVYQDDKLLAFNDISKAAPVHILIVPKKPYISFDDFVQKATSDEIVYLLKKTQEIAQKAGLVKNGYRLIMNHNDDASQTIHHFHIHILGGKFLGGLISGDKLAR